MISIRIPLLNHIQIKMFNMIHIIQKIIREESPFFFSCNKPVKIIIESCIAHFVRNSYKKKYRW